jgi:hypothetical protein
MSAPAQNPRPDPVTTMARTLSSFALSTMARFTLACMAGVQAFSRSGRFSVIQATPSSTAYRM